MSQSLNIVSATQLLRRKEQEKERNEAVVTVSIQLTWMEPSDGKDITTPAHWASWPGGTGSGGSRSRTLVRTIRWQNFSLLPVVTRSVAHSACKRPPTAIDQGLHRIRCSAWCASRTVARASKLNARPGCAYLLLIVLASSPFLRVAEVLCSSNPCHEVTFRRPFNMYKGSVVLRIHM